MQQIQRIMETNQVSLFEKLERLRITASSDIKPHEFLFNWNDTPCFARGELVAVTGKAKSGKTYLNSLLMAACASDGQLGLTRKSDAALRVLWIDTEQSEDTTFEILQDRIGAMIGAEPSQEQFHVFNLRQVHWKERIDLVLASISICQPDIVIFDGIRDVVGDINDYAEAQTVIGQLLSIASFTHACIVCVLHQNKAVEDKTLRGALGTELQNKSFETYECTKDPESRIFKIRQIATRKYDMTQTIQFVVSAEGLPIASFSPDEEKQAPKYRNSFNPAYVADSQIDKQRLFNYILPLGKQMDLTQLRAVVMKVAWIRSFNFAYRVIEEACEQGIIRLVEHEGNNVYELSSP